jgi:rRNA-processing protein FCF1
MMPAALLRYERWTESAQRELRQVFATESIVSRLRADRYWIIVSSPPGLPRTASLIHSELSELRNYFTEKANELRVMKAKYPQANWLVLDTNDLLHYYRFDQVPWKALYGKNVRVAMPHVVIDEVDSKSYNAGAKIQQRARGIYRVLETLLDRLGPDGQAAALADGTPFTILTEEPGYDRMPNNDDEIVAQALALQQSVHPGAVTLITRDIGMRARAVARGVTAAKMPDKYLIREEALATSDLEIALEVVTAPDTGVGPEKK